MTNIIRFFPSRDILHILKQSHVFQWSVGHQKDSKKKKKSNNQPKTKFTFLLSFFSLKSIIIQRSIKYNCSKFYKYNPSFHKESIDHSYHQTSKLSHFYPKLHILDTRVKRKSNFNPNRFYPFSFLLFFANKTQTLQLSS